MKIAECTWSLAKRDRAFLHMQALMSRWGAFMSCSKPQADGSMNVMLAMAAADSRNVSCPSVRSHKPEHESDKNETLRCFNWPPWFICWHAGPVVMGSNSHHGRVEKLTRVPRSTQLTLGTRNKS